MEIHLTNEQLLQLTVLFTVTALLLCVTVWAYLVYRRKHTGRRLQTGIKENARATIKQFNQHRQRDRLGFEGEHRGITSDDDSNKSILNVNKILRMNTNETLEYSGEFGALKKGGLFDDEAGLDNTCSVEERDEEKEGFEINCVDKKR